MQKITRKNLQATRVADSSTYADRLARAAAHSDQVGVMDPLCSDVVHRLPTFAAQLKATGCGRLATVCGRINCS